MASTATSSIKYSATALGTRIGWKAAQIAVGYLPEDWQTALSGENSDEDIKEFLTYGVGFEKESGAGVPTQAQMKAYDSKYYLNNETLTRPIFMYLQPQGMETYFGLPCVNGYPIIKMGVVHNQQPIATNNLNLHTNRRVKPTVFQFSFPVAYLRVYGANEYGVEVNKNSWYDDFTNSLKEGFNTILPDSMQMELTNKQQKDRMIPTYSQVYEELVRFCTQQGCYLYMGFGREKINVSADIQISATKNDIDCLWVDITLTETQEFTMEQLNFSSGILSNQKSQYSNGTSISNGSINAGQ